MDINEMFKNHQKDYPNYNNLNQFNSFCESIEREESEISLDSNPEMKRVVSTLHSINKDLATKNEDLKIVIKEKEIKVDILSKCNSNLSKKFENLILESDANKNLSYFYIGASFTVGLILGSIFSPDLLYSVSNN